MSHKNLKVTDRRMFTADGELREGYRRRQQENAEGASDPATTRAPPPAATPAEARSDASPQPDAARPDAVRPSDPIAKPQEPEDRPGAPAFFDLVGLLAEPASIYLREARSADPQTAAQSLELARLHIELLIILRDKTRGNLSPQEQGMLEDVLSQLRSGFVGLRG